MKTILILLLAVLGACLAPDMEPTGASIALEVTDSAVEALLNPPAPQPQFQFCDGLITCSPLNPEAADIGCTASCLETAYCPGYTLAELSTCRRNPNAAGCCDDLDNGGSVPCGRKRCIKGNRP